MDNTFGFDDTRYKIPIKFTFREYSSSSSLCIRFLQQEHNRFSMYFWGSFIYSYFLLQLSNCFQCTICSEFIFKLCHVKFVFNIYLQPYQNMFLPIENMRNNLKFYANMRLLTYRFFYFLNLTYTLQKYNRLYHKFKR